jgi:hypothetical protein
VGASLRGVGLASGGSLRSKGKRARTTFPLDSSTTLFIAKFAKFAKFTD